MDKAKACLQKVFCHHPTVEDEDSGSSILVLFWAVISRMLGSGFFFGVYGSITVEHQEKFGMSLTESSLVSSINTFLIYCFAPLASILIVQISSRFVEILGGVCLVVGIGGSAFSTEAWHIYLLFGVVAGVGSSCCYMASSSILVHHFDKYKYVAFSIFTLGFFAGIIIFPMVSERLFAYLGYPTTMGIFGLIMILHIFGGSFFTEKYSSSAPTCFCSKFCDERVHQGEVTLDTPTDHSPLLKKMEVDRRITGHVSVDQDTQEKSHQIVIVEELTNVVMTEQTEAESGKDISVLVAFKSLLSDWKVWCLMFNLASWTFNRSSLFIFINDYVVKYVGLSTADAALGVTLLGVSSCVGVFVTVSMGRLDFNRLAYHSSLCAILGTCTLILAFTNGRVMYYSCTLIFGLAEGADVANLLAVYYDFCGADLLPILLSINLVCAGIGGLVTSPICSYMETEVSPAAGLITSGIAGIISSLILLPVSASTIFAKRRAERLESTSRDSL